MNIFQQRQFDRFARASQWVDAHSKEFAPNSQAIRLNTSLKSTLDSLEEVAQAPTPEAPQPKASASAKKAALNALRAELDKIALTADALKKVDPEFNNTFALPDKRLKEKLVDAARQFQKDAEPLKDRFTDFELRSDFLETLGAKLEAYKATQSPQTARTKGPKPKSAGATGPFAQASQLMDVLDVVVKNKYEGNDSMLKDWQNATRLNTPPRRRKGEEVANEPVEVKPASKPGRKPRASKN